MGKSLLKLLMQFNLDLFPHLAEGRVVHHLAVKILQQILLLILVQLLFSHPLCCVSRKSI
jgi:hypothetical protein